MLIRPAIGDTDPIRYRRHTPDGQFSGNIIDEAMRPLSRGIGVQNWRRRSAQAQNVVQPKRPSELADAR
jgi:hypothetical protein